MTQNVRLVQDVTNLERTAEHIGRRRATKADPLQQLFIVALDGGWPIGPDVDGVKGKRAIPVFTKIMNGALTVRNAPDLDECNVELGFATGGTLQLTTTRERLVAMLDLQMLDFLPPEVQAKLQDGMGAWKKLVWVPEGAWRTLCALLTYDKEWLLSFGDAIDRHKLTKEAVDKAHESSLTWVKPLDANNDPDKAAQTFAHLVIGMCAQGMGWQANGTIMSPYMPDGEKNLHPGVWVLKTLWSRQIFSYETLRNGRNGQDEVRRLTRELRGYFWSLADTFAEEALALAEAEWRLTHKLVSEVCIPRPEGKVGLYDHLPRAERDSRRSLLMQRADQVWVKTAKQELDKGTLDATFVKKAIAEGLFSERPDYDPEHPMRCGAIQTWIDKADRCQLVPPLKVYRAIPKTLLREDRKEEYQKKFWALFESGKISEAGLEWALKQLSVWAETGDPSAAPTGQPVKLAVARVTAIGALVAAIFLFTGDLGTIKWPIGLVLLGVAGGGAYFGGIQRRGLRVWAETGDPSAAPTGQPVKLAVARVTAIGALVAAIFLFTGDLGTIKWPIGLVLLGVAGGGAYFGGIQRRGLLRGIIDIVDFHFDDFLFKGFTLGLLEASWAVVALNVATKLGLAQEVCSFGYIGAFLAGWFISGRLIRKNLLESSTEVNQTIGLALLLVGIVLAVTGVPVMPDLSGLFGSLGGGTGSGGGAAPVPTTQLPASWPTPTTP